MCKEYQCSLTFHKMFLILGLSDVSLSLDSGYTFLRDACLHCLGSSQAITPGITHWSPLVMLILNCQSRYCQFLHYMRIIVFFSLKPSMQSIGRLQWYKSLLFMDVVSIDDSCPIPWLTRRLLQINAFPGSALLPCLPVGPWLSTVTVEFICAANSIHLLL